MAMPSYMVKQPDRAGKAQYQDVCFLVTKEFQEKLYDVLLEAYYMEKEKVAVKSRTQVERVCMKKECRMRNKVSNTL